jgi:ATP phosphoribosyltransferase regulatory subunit
MLPRTSSILAPPAGMRDLLPPEAAARQWLGARLTQLFEAWGYDLVTTPPFEHAEVIERGLETIDRRDLLRFVEPETGEVALLRPDITPQIARIVATRLADRPPPFRLCYAGSVIRQRQGRARRQRQIAQAGIEHIGTAGPEADAEVIALAARVLEELGLEEFRVELHQVGLLTEALRGVPDREGALDALERKDRAELARAMAGASGADRVLAAIDLYGGTEVLGDARRLFGEDLAELADVIARLEAAGLGPRLALDLGEVREAAYYTGVSFRVLARGPGEPIGSGGRYDGLLARFGAPLPATGFGLDLSNLEWALAAAGRAFAAPRPARFVVAGEDRERVASSLRAAGFCAAALWTPAEQALDYARAWGYDAAVIGGRVVRASDREERALAEGSLEDLGRFVRS